MQTSAKVSNIHQIFSDAFTILGVFMAFMVYGFIYIPSFPPYGVHVALGCIALGFLLTAEVARLRLRMAGRPRQPIDRAEWLHGCTLALMAVAMTLLIVAYLAATIVETRAYLYG